MYKSEILLGWKLYTRGLLISLPEDHLLAWTRTIDEIIIIRITKVDYLETLIGSLAHLVVSITQVVHFLSILRLL